MTGDRAMVFSINKTCCNNMIEIFLEKWHSTPIIKSCKYMTGYEQTDDGGEGKMAHKFIHSKDR